MSRDGGPPVAAAWDAVATVDAIDSRDFYGEFVARRRPVVIRNLTSGWRALDWSLDYFRHHARATKLAVKLGDIADGRREDVTFSGYVESLELYEAQIQAGQDHIERPGYLHDVPFFHYFPELKSDAEPFPLHLFPRWYQPNWQDHVQCFMGPTGSVTPLHFDTLLTNNLFFHLVGRKQFILIPAEQRELCYIHGWRWARFDPSAPDFDAFPLALRTTPVPIVLEPGDILYIPPGTLHHVSSLSLSFSFNIDWHTAESARKGVMTVFRGAPRKNAYYNLLSFLGLGLHVPPKYVFPFYKSYLTYVT